MYNILYQKHMKYIGIFRWLIIDSLGINDTITRFGLGVFEFKLYRLLKLITAKENPLKSKTSLIPEIEAMTVVLKQGLIAATSFDGLVS